MADEEVWKQRFKLFVTVRLIGLATIVAGLVIAISDLVREGGWPLLGGIITVMGAADAVLAPRLLRKHWEQQDRR